MYIVSRFNPNFMNPFYISGYNEHFFCDRREETKLLLEAVENGRNILIHSPRRLGKTSLIKHFLHQMKKEKCKCIYVDLYATYSMNDLVEQLAHAVLETFFTHNLLNGIKRILKGITASFTISPEGGANLSIALSDKQVATGLGQIFDFLEKRKERVIVAFDEFQQIANYPQNAEAVLRSHVQHLSDVRFLYSGSSAHLLTEMFLNAKRPFYQSSDVMSLKKIHLDVYSDFIRQCFEKAGKKISTEALELIIDFTEVYTYYTQVLSNLVFSITVRTAGIKEVRLAIQQVLDSRKDDYSALLRLFSTNQLKLMKAVAKEDGVEQISSKLFLNTYGFSSATVIQASRVLIEKEFLYHTDRGIMVYDLFLKRFLQRI